MFLLSTITDTIRVPAHMLALPTLTALHSEIDTKYPNRVLMDVGMVISRYGECLKITNGSCVPGDGGSHHECLFRLIVFRPFVEEVCVGKIVKSSAEGIQVSIGFFQDIFIPAYWMLRPSHYDERIRLWVWTPNYDEEGEENEESTEQPQTTEDGDGEVAKEVVETNGEKVVESAKKIDQACEGTITNGKADTVGTVKQEDGTNTEATTTEEKKDEPNNEGEEEQAQEAKEEEPEDQGDRFEMDIGSEIRFKVKSIHFTQVTKTAKGVQATTTTTAHSHTFPKEKQEEKTSDKPLRKRSTSVDLSDVHNMPASMHIVASICEDGLGLTSWWTAAEEEDEEEDGDENDNETEEQDGEAPVEEDYAEDYVGGDE